MKTTTTTTKTPRDNRNDEGEKDDDDDDDELGSVGSQCSEPFPSCHERFASGVWWAVREAPGCLAMAIVVTWFVDAFVNRLQNAD